MFNLRKSDHPAYKVSGPRYRILRWQVPQWLALSLALSFLLLLIASFFLLGIFRDLPRDPGLYGRDATSGVSDQTLASDPVSGPSLGTILARHRKGNGLSSVNSLLFRGRITLENKRTYAGSLLLRRPDHVKQALRDFRVAASLSFNGESYTATRDGVVMPSGDHPERIDSNLNRHSLLLEGAFAQLAWDDGDTRYAPVFLGTELFRGSEYHRIEKSYAGITSIEYLLEVDSARVIARRLRFSIGEQTTELLLVLSDFQSHGALTLPMSYELFRDGTLVVTASFTEVIPDAGLLSEAFE